MGHFFHGVHNYRQESMHNERRYLDRNHDGIIEPYEKRSIFSRHHRHHGYGDDYRNEGQYRQMPGYQNQQGEEQGNNMFSKLLDPLGIFKGLFG